MTMEVYEGGGHPCNWRVLTAFQISRQPCISVEHSNRRQETPAHPELNPRDRNFADDESPPERGDAAPAADRPGPDFGR